MDGWAFRGFDDIVKTALLVGIGQAEETVVV